VAVGSRRWNWRDAVFDVAPALGFLVIGLLDIATGLSAPTGPASPTTAIVPVIVVCAALLFRRHWPLAAFVAVVLVIAVPAWLGSVALTYWGEFVPWLLASYSVTRHESRLWRSFVALAASALTLTAISLRFPEMADPGDVLYNGAFLAAAWGLGLFARSWAAYRDDTLRLEIERAQAEERAGLLERARIARELHDVIAHTITVILMQAGGARLASQSDPEAALRALSQIEALGRDSLAEPRILLAVLRRESEDDGDRAPLPDLGRVGELCERMRALGLPVAFDPGATTADLPLGVQLTAYRIVQEGLTNVIKHAGTVPTTVRLARATPSDPLVVEVANAAPEDAVVRLPGSRRGLFGLDERVASLGGRLTSGVRADGGFMLRAELPASGARP